MSPTPSGLGRFCQSLMRCSQALGPDGSGRSGRLANVVPQGRYRATSRTPRTGGPISGRAELLWPSFALRLVRPQESAIGPPHTLWTHAGSALLRGRSEGALRGVLGSAAGGARAYPAHSSVARRCTGRLRGDGCCAGHPSASVRWRSMRSRRQSGRLVFCDGSEPPSSPCPSHRACRPQGGGRTRP